MPLGAFRADQRRRVSSMKLLRAIVPLVLVVAGCGSGGSDSSAGSASSSGGAGGGGGASGLNGVYSSVTHEELKIEFKSGGVVVFSAGDMGSSNGTYTVDGEKVIVDNQGQKTTFIRDGECMEDPQNIYGRMCKGGKAGAAAHVSTRNAPTTPSGTWFAKNADGEFRIDFKPDNKLTLHITPAAGVPGKPETQEGKFEIEGDSVYITLANSTPLVLKYVNNAYESSSFGLPMKFIKQ